MIQVFPFKMTSQTNFLKIEAEELKENATEIQIKMRGRGDWLIGVFTRIFKENKELQSVVTQALVESLEEGFQKDMKEFMKDSIVKKCEDCGLVHPVPKGDSKVKTCN